MFRSNSTRRGPAKYEKLDKEFAASETWNEELKRSTSLPSGASNSMAKMAMGSNFGDINLQKNPTKKTSSKQKEKSHPLFSFFDFRRKKKPTATPEFTRYVEYLKEGGMWNSDSSKPVIYYK